MTLHEEINQILIEKASPLSTKRIAELVKIRGNYSKKDGSEVTPYQIHGRTKNYSHLFIRDKSVVGLIGRDENKMNNGLN